MQPWLVEAHRIRHGKTHCSQHAAAHPSQPPPDLVPIHKAGSMVPDMLMVVDSILVHLGMPKQAKA